MPTAADGSVLGDDAKLYYSATLGGSGTLTEVPVVIDDTIGSERRTAESNCRGDSEISEHVGKPKHTISGTMLFKRGTPGATYLTLRNAYAAGTLLHFALASGTVTDTAQHVFRIEGKFKRWEESRPDNDTIKASFEISRRLIPATPRTGQWSQARSVRRMFCQHCQQEIEMVQVGQVDEVKVIHADGSEGTAKLLVVAVVGRPAPQPQADAE